MRARSEEEGRLCSRKNPGRASITPHPRRRVSPDSSNGWRPAPSAKRAEGGRVPTQAGRGKAATGIPSQGVPGTVSQCAGAVGVNQTTQQAKVEATRLRIQQVEQALQLHAVTHKGRYPTTSEGLETVRDSLSGGTVPTDAWGNQLQYFSPGSHSQEDFEIVSLGRDGQAGGEGPDADIYSWENP